MAIPPTAYGFLVCNGRELEQPPQADSLRTTQKHMKKGIRQEDAQMAMPIDSLAQSSFIINASRGLDGGPGSVCFFFFSFTWYPPKR